MTGRDWYKWCRDNRPSNIPIKPDVIYKNKEGKILFTKRNSQEEFSPGLWDFPGGSVNLDECVNDSIKREANEELQIELIETEVFKINSGKGIPSGQFIFVLFASKKYNLKDGIKLSHEHSEHKWISLD